MENDRLAIVYVANEKKELTFSYKYGQTIEDLCIKVCKSIGIGPVARHLFALRNHYTKLWYPLAHCIESKDIHKFDLRLRFKPSSLRRLQHIDTNAYDYYFQQARSDVMDNKVPDIVYDRHKQELIGLGVCDMYRVMLEKKVSRETVESDYRKYIPKECIKRHAFFIKKPIQNALRKISGYDANYVKEQYLKQFECMAPNYPYEEYEVLMDRGLQNPPTKVTLRVNVDAVKYYETNATSLTILCAIEDLCFVSIRQDNTVEISRKNGIPSYLTFGKNAHLMSFVSALDGYYRLAVKWTFNLCGEIVTPTLERLHKLKCHGPVGQDFSYVKLQQKRANKPGSYLLRESETEYNVYYLDACNKEGKLFTERIEERVLLDDFVITGISGQYNSLAQCVASFKDSEGSSYLSECLPPSEYDKSSLLLCASESAVSEVAADEEIVASVLKTGPHCVPRNQLELYKPFLRGTETQHYSPTALYRGIWRITKGQKLEVALKILKQEEEVNYTKEFLDLAGKWCQLRSSALVRSYGLTVTPSIGMILELVQQGPLDEYLRSSSSQTIKTVDMVEATACLATALWHLEENGVVHGNIRCNKLLVHAHTNNSFVVKLADPGLFTYTETDVHWLPPETYNDPELARHSFQADVWAVGTTIWQIFTRGATLLDSQNAAAMKKYYRSGKRLLMPNGCPTEVYRLMLDCWGDLSGTRKQPQTIMRDINQILYQVYNSRRSHAYTTAFPKLFSSGSKRFDEHNSDNIDSKSICSESRSSLYTYNTSLPWNDTDDSMQSLMNTNENYIDSTEDLSAHLDLLSGARRDSEGCSISENRIPNINRIGHSTQALRIGHHSNLGEVIGRNEPGTEDCGSRGSSNGSSGQLRGIYELNIDCNVILQGRIGQGFYGEVYRGTLERDNGKDIEPQQVAIKKLKTRALEADILDFEREIAIMKTLKHPNVVEILGVISEPEVCLVMEYVKHGSLQSYLAIHKQELTNRRLLSFALDIATGMDYLGSMSIVHRDLAARNILVADENRVKISDFGLAQVTGKNDYYILQTDRGLPIKWYAPESIRDGKFSTRSDVWSFGVTMYETFGFGEEPRLPGVDSSTERLQNEQEKGSTELLAALERGTRLPCPSTCPQAIYVKIMYPCWHLQSHQRPDFASLCKDIRDLLDEY
ncbi:tyrosine-protein kinase hopscotch isoform X1 [Megalopta genalis]|uniref:tyrosine-protein kinase hopscotch isoform X1 n=1 Tax=Megalopta genalis TaxID=115081 RepID=UPI0014434EC2|nr:tyrosine-protein kinase hopscotch [Megalopta genalis]